MEGSNGDPREAGPFTTRSPCPSDTTPSIGTTAIGDPVDCAVDGRGSRQAFQTLSPRLRGDAPRNIPGRARNDDDVDDDPFAPCQPNDRLRVSRAAAIGDHQDDTSSRRSGCDMKRPIGGIGEGGGVEGLSPSGTENVDRPVERLSIGRPWKKRTWGIVEGNEGAAIGPQRQTLDPTIGGVTRKTQGRIPDSHGLRDIESDHAGQGSSGVLVRAIDRKERTRRAVFEQGRRREVAIPPRVMADGSQISPDDWKGISLDLDELNMLRRDDDRDEQCRNEENRRMAGHSWQSMVMMRGPRQARSVPCSVPGRTCRWTTALLACVDVDGRW